MGKNNPCQAKKIVKNSVFTLKMTIFYIFSQNTILFFEGIIYNKLVISTIRAPKKEIVFMLFIKKNF